MKLQKSLLALAGMSVVVAAHAADSFTVPVTITGTVAATVAPESGCELNDSSNNTVEGQAITFDLSGLPNQLVTAPASLGIATFDCTGPEAYTLSAATSGGYSSSAMAVTKYLTDFVAGDDSPADAIPVAFQAVQVNYYLNGTNLASATPVVEGGTVALTAQGYGTSCYVDFTADNQQEQFDLCSAYFQEYVSGFAENQDPRFHDGTGPDVDGGRYVTYAELGSPILNALVDAGVPVPGFEPTEIVFTVN